MQWPSTKILPCRRYIEMPTRPRSTSASVDCLQPPGYFHRSWSTGSFTNREFIRQHYVKCRPIARCRIMIDIGSIDTQYRLDPPQAKPITLNCAWRLLIHFVNIGDVERDASTIVLDCYIYLLLSLGVLSNLD